MNYPINLKLFAIDLNHSELKDKTDAEIINIIRANNLAKFHSEFDNDKLDDSLNYEKHGDFEIWTYCYNYPKENHYWKLFLPSHLTDKHNFKIIEFSFVLFVLYNKILYCTIGGGGMGVIKKYIDKDFGIDVYRHIASPSEDVVIELIARGVASNISQKKENYYLNQKLSEALNYSELPIKMKVLLRNELKEGLFKKYNLKQERVIMEIGSFFSLRKKITFPQLKQLILDIDQIREENVRRDLTLFKKIRESDEIDNLNNFLLNKVAEDVSNLYNSPHSQPQLKDVIEIVHPTKLEKFYDCDSFNLKFKYSRTDNFVLNRSYLYIECLKIISKKVTDITDLFKIKKLIYKLKIIGINDGKETTWEQFFAHILAEIEYKGSKYFRIDNDWYQLEDEFVDRITEDAKNFYLNHVFPDKTLLNSWKSTDDEDAYNLSHKSRNYFILDKNYTEGIEICDILFLKDNILYFVHVKDDFNTNLRNLYIQIILAAKRLYNDLNNSKGISFLKNTLELYNKRVIGAQIDVDEIIKAIKNKDISIEFVMAYNNRAYQGKLAHEKNVIF